MKQYVTGLLALVFAITAFAFTKESKKVVNGKAVAGDACSDANKVWFYINLECNSQNAVTDIRNSGNYTLADADIYTNCTGTECICAIYACPTAGGQYPIISQGTTIYTALTNFYNLGTTSPYLLIKDQYWGKR